MEVSYEYISKRDLVKINALYNNGTNHDGDIQFLESEIFAQHG